MKRLIQLTIARRIHLLDILVHSNQWIHTSYLIKKLKCSQQTLLSDCEYFENEWRDYVSIEFSKKQGVRLYANKHHSIDELYKKLIKSSTDFTLLELIFFYPYAEDTFYMNRLFISESSLYRSYKRLNQVLNDRQIDIQHIDDTYALVAKNEVQLRWFLTLYFCEAYEDDEWPFPVSKDNVYQCIALNKRTMPFKNTMSELRFFSYLIAIALIREEQGFSLSNETIAQSQTQECKSGNPSLTAFLKNNYPNINPDLFYRSIFWWAYEWSDKTEYLTIKQFSEEFIHTLCVTLNITIAKKNQQDLIFWLQFIYVRHKLYPFKEYILHSRFSATSLAIKHTYSNFAAKVNKLLYSMELKSDFPWNTKYFEEILFETFFRWNSLYKKLDKKNAEITLYIYSDLGKEHAEFLSYSIKQRFQDKVKIVYEKDETHLIQTVDYKTYDLIISNCILEPEANEDFIIVEDILSPKNWIDISLSIGQKMQQKEQ